MGARRALEFAGEIGSDVRLYLPKGTARTANGEAAADNMLHYWGFNGSNAERIWIRTIAQAFPCFSRRIALLGGRYFALDNCCPRDQRTTRYVLSK